VDTQSHISSQNVETLKKPEDKNTIGHLHEALGPDEESIKNILLFMKNIKLLLFKCPCKTSQWSRRRDFFLS